MKKLLEVNRVIPGLFIFSLLCLFFYSYTQVDLGLTLTRASIFTDIQKAFQSIGYFNRPLSTYLYSSIMTLLFIGYGGFIYAVAKNKITRSKVWLVIGITAVVGVISYTAFSYDIFNYIFDAKILTHYHLNPYEYKALDFPGDKMLAFMHWTHRTYPYGPVWLILTAPLSLLGMQIFIPTFFLFKLLAGCLYLGTVWAVGRIMRILSGKYELLAMVLFALNPLVIIESLVTGHNDIAMMFLCTVSLLFLIQKRYALAFVVLFLSIGIKYATGFLLPLYLVIFLFERKKVQIEWERILIVFIVAMLFALIAASLRTTFQPWYLLYILPFLSLIAYKKGIVAAVIVLSVAGVMNYIPYLYLGNWDPPVPTILFGINLVAIIVSMTLASRVFLPRKK